jgi:hypothetical protein
MGKPSLLLRHIPVGPQSVTLPTPLHYVEVALHRSGRLNVLPTRCFSTEFLDV